jgi:hypothetical protein
LVVIFGTCPFVQGYVFLLTTTTHRTNKHRTDCRKCNTRSYFTNSNTFANQKKVRVCF